MKLYYTTSVGYNCPQDNSNLSLGGYKAASLVQNDCFENLFDELSIRTMAEGKTQYIAIVLKNDSDKKVENIVMWFVPDLEQTMYCSFKIGATAMSLDSENQFVMERTDTVFSKPFQAQFYSAEGEEDAVAIGSLDPNQEVGIWISRSILSDLIKEEYNKVAEKDPLTQNRYRAVKKATSESIGLQIKWDELVE